MGKGPAEWSQSIPNRKVNDASISTTFKLILNWYGPITTSSSITPTVCLYLIGRNFRMLGPSSSFSSYPNAPAPGPLHCSTCKHSNHSHYQSPLQVLSGPDKTPKKRESGCVGVVLSAGISSSEKVITLGAMICPTK